MRSQSLTRRLLAVLVAAAVAFILIKATGWPGNGNDSADPSNAPTTSASTGSLGKDPVSGLPYVTVDQLPQEAATVLDEIDEGGPFEYPKNDGVVFDNREGILPKEKSGYYHEYTVPTPGSSDRGTRRIITGSSGEFFYTGDHYSSFERVLR